MVNVAFCAKACKGTYLCLIDGGVSNGAPNDLRNRVPPHSTLPKIRVVGAAERPVATPSVCGWQCCQTGKTNAARPTSGERASAEVNKLQKSRSMRGSGKTVGHGLAQEVLFVSAHKSDCVSYLVSGLLLLGSRVHQLLHRPYRTGGSCYVSPLCFMVKSRLSNNLAIFLRRRYSKSVFLNLFFKFLS